MSTLYRNRGDVSPCIEFGANVVSHLATLTVFQVAAVKILRDYSVVKSAGTPENIVPKPANFTIQSDAPLLVKFRPRN